MSSRRMEWMFEAFSGVHRKGQMGIEVCRSLSELRVMELSYFIRPCTYSERLIAVFEAVSDVQEGTNGIENRIVNELSLAY